MKQLVAAHGGSVTAESRGLGQGATFVVLIPARAAVSTARPGSDADCSEDDAEASRSLGPRLDGLRVLVIDDEPDSREIVAEILRERGAEVDLAASASEGLQRFRTRRPDVIVSDIGMPGTDGFQLIRAVRGTPIDEGGLTPAVALTAYAHHDDVKRALAAGYQMHLAKPVDPMRLTTAVAALRRAPPER